jgi:hypothetical protein
LKYEQKYRKIKEYLQNVAFFINFAAKNESYMIRNRYKISYWILLFVVTLLIACQPQPQKAKHLSEEKELDSTMLAQLELNANLAAAADKECSAFVQADSIEYTMDDFGFWYTKTITSNTTDTIQRGEEVIVHIQINKLGGTLISDAKLTHIVGNGDLPTAITRSLKMMHYGEQMRIVTPWYTAYGVEGTKLIKPYSNLLIIITIEE